MDIAVFSRSPTFMRHLKAAIEDKHHLDFKHSVKNLAPTPSDGKRIVIVHAASFSERLEPLLGELSDHPQITVAVASDMPDLQQMLGLSRYKIHAYFNSYMADTHYHQMLRLLEAGQSWFIPDLLSRALELARLNFASVPVGSILTQLTPRERDIALAVRLGYSNKRIATSLGITERTVKSHLTNIFAKLGIKDRVTLVIMLNGEHQPLAKNN